MLDDILADDVSNFNPQIKDLRAESSQPQQLVTLKNEWDKENKVLDTRKKALDGLYFITAYKREKGGRDRGRERARERERKRERERERARARE